MIFSCAAVVQVFSWPHAPVLVKSANQGVVSTSPSFLKPCDFASKEMNLDPAIYKTQVASQLAADPFFQEWVFHPLGEKIQPFWLDLLISNSVISWKCR